MASRIAVRGELSLDGSGWDKTLRLAGNQIQNFGTNTLGALKGQIAAAFSIGAITAFTKSVISSVEHIKDMSEQFGVTTDEVQILGRAAEHIGLEFEDIGTALSKMGKARKDAAEGNVELRETFQRFGVTLGDLNDPAQRNVDLLLKMAEAMKGIQFNSAQREELRDLFGRGGDKLAALFEEMQKISQNPITIISNEQINAIDKAKKDIDDMWKTLQAMAATKIAPVAKDFNEGNMGHYAKDYLKLLGRTFDPLGIGYFDLDKILKHGLPTSTPKGNAPFLSYDQHIDSSKQPTSLPNNEPMFENKLLKQAGEAQPLKFEQSQKIPIQSDQLTRVGNFLGDSNKILTTAEKQLGISQGMLAVLNLIHFDFKTLDSSTGYP